jgi:hypothetical protein
VVSAESPDGERPALDVRIFTLRKINRQFTMASQAAILIVGDSAMLSREQLQQISTSIDHALKVSSSEPRGLLRYLLTMASMEIALRIKSQPEPSRRAA